MPYTLIEEKTYPVSAEKLTQAVLGAINGLEGSVLKHNPETGRIEAKFNKTILGKVLGDRSQIEIDLAVVSPEEAKITATVYPINPIGQKLQFGARKGISRTVMTWFFAHVEHRLK
jgi:hypothetical protein